MNRPQAAGHPPGVGQHTVGRSAPWQGERRRRRTDLLMVHPAEADFGIRFLCRGAAADTVTLAARWDMVVDTRGGVVLGNAQGASLRGVIPLLAALRIAGIDNALVEVQGSRIPADEDDFAFYLEMLAAVGVQAQPVPRRLLRVVDTIEVRDSFGYANLTPASGFRACVNTTTIRLGGQADLAYGVVMSEFVEPIGGFRASVGGGESRPLAIGTLPGALRTAVIDLVGHLTLAGAPLAGCLHARGSGPSLYQALLHAAMGRRAIAPTTVDAERARTVTRADIAPSSCPTCDGAGDRP